MTSWVNDRNTAEQHAAETDWDRLTPEQQAAILEREQEVIGALASEQVIFEAPKPRRVRPVKTFSFRRSSYAAHAAVLSITRDPDYGVSIHYLTHATFNRFVALANSGKYDITVGKSNTLFDWLLRRNARIDNTVDGLRRDLAGAKRYIDLMHQAMDSMGVRNDVDQAMIQIEDEELPIC